MLTLFYVLISYTHTQFAIKYWVLSRKIMAILNKFDDKRLQTKSYVIFYSIISLIIITSVYYLVTRWDFNEFGKEDK